MKALRSISDEILKETKLQSLQQKKDMQGRMQLGLKKEMKEENKYRKDAFFHLSNELQELESSKISRLEKYFSIASKSLMNKIKLIQITDDFGKKKLLEMY